MHTHAFSFFQPIDSSDDSFWDQLWSEHTASVQDVFTLLPASEIRMVREESPQNLATLCYKAVEKLVRAVDNSCRTQHDQQTGNCLFNDLCDIVLIKVDLKIKIFCHAVLNCCRLLTRVLPCMFENSDWRGFFWSSLPAGQVQEGEEAESTPLAVSLVNAVCVSILFNPS